MFLLWPSHLAQTLKGNANRPFDLQRMPSYRGRLTELRSPSGHLLLQQTQTLQPRAQRDVRLWEVEDGAPIAPESDDGPEVSLDDECQIMPGKCLIKSLHHVATWRAATSAEFHG
jgi:hypothetical protein